MAKALKHYFVVNPTAGKGLRATFVKDTIEPACKKTGIDYEIYYTKAAGDGIRFVKETAAKGDPCRFYACGGDGTLYEVVNGAYGFKNAEVAVVPLGSGNDWTRLFGDLDIFLDIEGQINGKAIPLDCITCDDGKNVEVAINQASMGFDADACAVQGQMKKLPGVAGHLSYYLGGVYCMFSKVNNRYHITIDGKEQDGNYVFAVGCNSRWYGSGIKVAPFAMPDDHLMDVVLMKKDMPWIMMFFIMMFDWQNNEDTHVHCTHCEYIRAKQLIIHDNKETNNHTNIDGECHRTNDLKIDLIEDGLTFVVPAGSTYFADKESGKLSNEIKINDKRYKFRPNLF